jgi:hypothetical protein
VIAESGEAEPEGVSGSRFSIWFSMSLPSLRAERVLCWENRRVIFKGVRGWDWRQTEGNALVNVLMEKELIVVTGICEKGRIENERSSAEL